MSTENLLIEKARSTNGWTKLTDSNNQHYRTIRLGNNVNCNGELIKNLYIKNTLEEVMKKYNIDKYDINEVDTEFEFSYQLQLDNENYEKFIQEINKKQEKIDSNIVYY
tara:strand:+ start:80 stop:406 length:327 start_codon:yes stop_codon:yes gene_type:complete